MTKTFNHCIEIGKMPIEQKPAIANQLYKGEGVKSDLNSYRGYFVLLKIAKIFEKRLAKQISIY